MPDTTRKSWACDWCGKEYGEHSGGYCARFLVRVQSTSYLNKEHERDDGYVCQDCIEKLDNIANPVSNKSVV